MCYYSNLLHHTFCSQIRTHVTLPTHACSGCVSQDEVDSADTEESEAVQNETDPDSVEMSTYEARRAANMRENEEILKQLGLGKLIMNKKPKMLQKEKNVSNSLPPAPVRSSKRLQEVPRPNYLDDSYLGHLED